MRSQSLQLTKRGILISHWAIELIAGILIIAFVAGMLLFSLPDIAMPVLKVAGYLSTYGYPCLQVALVIGVMMTMAAPKASKVLPWGLAIMAVSFCANLWPVIVYSQDLPMSWLMSASMWILPFIQAVLFTAMLYRLANWVMKIEDSDPATNENPSARAKDHLDVLHWRRTVEALKFLLILGIGFLTILLAVLYIPALQSFVFQKFGFIAVIPALCVFLYLLAQFSRQVYNLNRLLNRPSKAVQDADQAWANIPQDAIRPSAILSTVLVLASYAGYYVANTSLAPGYFQRQIAKMQKDSPFGGAGLEKALGMQAPNLVMNTIGGDTLELQSLRGKTVVLNFWATWCGPCVAEMPALQRLSIELESQQVVFIGISDEPQPKLDEFAKSKGITYTIVSGSNWSSPFDRISAIPTTYILDSEGIIRDGFVGSRSYEELRGSISKVVARNSETSNTDLSSSDPGSSDPPASNDPAVSDSAAGK